MPERNAPDLPLPVARALRKLGSDIRDARLRRRIPTTLMATRAAISRTTLAKVERGDPGVQLGIYATVLFILGLHGRLLDVADVTSDASGLELQDEQLPKRIRLPKSGSRTKAPQVPK